MDMDGDATAVGLACSDPVISRLLAFCDQVDVKRSYTQFCRKHVDVFHGFQVDEDDEKTHTIHDLFLQYERLIETMVQDFLDDEQMTSDVFYTHCRRLVEREREREHGGEHDDTGDSENALLNLRVVLSALDFDAFCSLMAREAVETQRALKQAEDMGL